MCTLQEAAGVLQAKQKSNHWCEIKPVEEKNVRKKIYKSALVFLFCLKLQQKKIVPESFFRKLYNMGCNKAGKKDLYVKNNIFLCLCFSMSQEK